MPNYSIFNFDPDSLRAKIYGSENQAIATDADGKLEIRSISDAVSVTATNLDIRNLSEAQDSIAIYSFDGTNNIAVRSDSDGRLEIRSISDVVSVTATDLDIRDLTASSDSVLMYGYDGTDPVRIRTDSDGLLMIRSISDTVNVTGTLNDVPDFSETNYTNIETADDFTPLSYVDTATQLVYTFFVYNKGANSADVRLDVSPDETNFYTDVNSRSIEAGSTDAFVAKTFLRYTRIAYKSTSPGQATTLDVFVQKQSS